MPIIQRNLFPARPSSKKCDGPSILRVSTLVPTPSSSLNQPVNKKKSEPLPKGSQNKDSKKLKKSQSASLNSLLAINGSSGSKNASNGSNSSNGSKGHYDSSQDGFHSSDTTTSSDPLSLSSSSSGSVNEPSCNPNTGSNSNMISRRRILSRSRDALNHTDDYMNGTGGYHCTQDEDVWFNKAKLIEDHIEEIVTKWDQIDDEIWAKVICMERNRRVAKAYARAPILTVNGSDIGFDGHRIGLNGFKNPLRDKKVAEIKKEIEAGIKVRMDEDGNLLVKRLSKSDVFVLSFDSAKLESPSGEKMDNRKSVILFDMKQFQNELLREIRSTNPNPRALEEKCFRFISFAAIANEVLNTPVWLIVINLVALEMLVKILPNKIFVEDNFYSLPITISSKASGYFVSSPTPPKLPPRDLHNKKPPLTLPEPDYDDDCQMQLKSRAIGFCLDSTPLGSNFAVSLDDDPYYYGLSAHVPKFAHSRPVSVVRTNPPIMRKKLWSSPPPSTNLSLKVFAQPASVDQGMFRSRHGASLYTGRSQTLDYRVPPPQFYPPSLSMNAQRTSTPVNDNNEIYGINASMLRKNTQLYMRSTSSPSLKNIFSRKSNKDYNNNNSIK